MKFPVILFCLLILFSASALAVFNWWQPGNTQWNSPHAYYSLPYRNNWNSSDNSSYEKCLLPHSDFEPVVSDFNNDGVGDIVLVDDGNYLVVYDFDCNLEFAINGSYSSQPVLVNFDSDSYIELAAARDRQVDIIKFINPSYSITSYSYAAAKDAAAAFLTCNWLTTKTANQNCFIGFTSSRDIVKLNIGAGSGATLYSNFLPQSMQEGDIAAFTNIRFTTFNPITGLYDVSFRNAACPDLATGVDLTCQIWDENPALLYDISADSSTTGSNLRSSISPVWAGNSIYYAISLWTYASGTIEGSARLYDFWGGAKYNRQGYPTSYPSNWVVADFDKDGSDEFLYGSYETAIGYSIRVINADALTLEDTIQMNTSACAPFFNYSKREPLSIAVADFQVNASTLGIATPYGIFYTSSHACSQIFYTAGISSQGSNSSLVLSSIGSLLQPVLIYADAGAGYVIRNSLLTDTCGNSVCDSYETAFNCPQDCNIPINDTPGIEPGTQGTGQPCDSNTDCASGLCNFLSRCQLKGANVACESDAQCQSGTCANGVCNTPSAWQLIDASKDETLGDDTPTNNMISIIISLILAAVLIIGGVALHVEGMAPLVGGIIVFYAAMIFFTMVGWLSAFILFGIILLAIVIAVAAIFMNSGG